MAFDFKRLDIYRKIPEGIEQKTLSGAVISTICCLVIAFLVTSEFIAFLSVELTSELYVDSSEPDDSEKIPVTLNITLPRLPCSVVGLDIQDDMGRHEMGFLENTNKIKIEGGLGCRFEAKFMVNKVPGNFHVSTHSASVQPSSIDMAHFINELTFGEDLSVFDVDGGFNSLRKKDKTNVQAIESHEYHMKIVPTIYETSGGKRHISYQYTAAYKSFISLHHSGRVLPAIWFRYDMNPITVKYTRKQRPLYAFLTTMCAIVGGVFVVAGIIDYIIFTTSSFFVKLEIGKQS